jgi:hypothetical protein
MYIKDPLVDGRLLEISGNHSNDSTSIRLIDPGTDLSLISIAGTPLNGANLNLYNSGTSTEVVQVFYDSLTGGGNVQCYSDHDDATGTLNGRELSFYDGTTTNVYINVSGSGYLSGNLGLGEFPPTNILHVQQSSVTDPIADAWTTYSSRRWKNNIHPLEDALDRVQRLRGVSFDWTTDEKHDIGLIAEEVGQVVPEIVTYEDNGLDARSVDYGRLTALLVEAIKELSAANEELRSRVELLEQE